MRLQAEVTDNRGGLLVEKSPWTSQALQSPALRLASKITHPVFLPLSRAERGIPGEKDSDSLPLWARLSSLASAGRLESQPHKGLKRGKRLCPTSLPKPPENASQEPTQRTCSAARCPLAKVVSNSDELRVEVVEQVLIRWKVPVE